MVKLAVLGGGINGLSCAVQIMEKYKNYRVTLISSDFSPNTTGDGSGGLWYPYLCGNTPSQLIEKWAGETFKYLRGLWRTGAVDICLMPVYYLYTQEGAFTRPGWADIVYGYRELNSEQLDILGRRHSSKYFAGVIFTTFVVPPPAILAYFMKRFKEANGEIIQAKLTSLEDVLLKEFDVVINCTGLGARFLVPDDEVVPIRGQIARVKASYLNEVILVDSNHYIIPNVDMCVLGGTSQNSYSTDVDQEDFDHIMNGCKRLIPGLVHAQSVSHWVGLRPGRNMVRLEAENINGKLYIHNYGHGGSGFTLFWGCCNEVLKILENYLIKDSRRISKL